MPTLVSALTSPLFSPTSSERSSGWSTLPEKATRHHRLHLRTHRAAWQRVLCNPAEKIKSMDTKRRGLIASVSTGRQQSALSCDISTWHNHAFLKHFPCTHTAIWYTGNAGTHTQDPHRLWLSPLTISWDPTATTKSCVLGRMKKGG